MPSSGEKKILEVCNSLIQNAGPTIRMRGKDYERAGRVIQYTIDFFDRMSFTIYATVAGRKLYDVTISSSGYYRCTCPYNRQTQEVCKHIVAVCEVITEDISKTQSALDTVKSILDPSVIDPAKEKVPAVVLQILPGPGDMRFGIFVIASVKLDRNGNVKDISFNPTDRTLDKIPPSYRELLLSLKNSPETVSGLIIEHIKDYPYLYYQTRGVIRDMGFGKLKIDTAPVDFELTFFEDEGKYELYIPDSVIFIQPFLFHFDEKEGVLRKFSAGPEHVWLIQAIKDHTPMEREEFIEVSGVIRDKGIRIRHIKKLPDIKPTPMLKIREQNGFLQEMSLYFKYYDREVGFNDSEEFILSDKGLIHRDLLFESDTRRKIQKIFRNHGFEYTEGKVFLGIKAITEFVSKVLPELQMNGIQVYFGIKRVKYSSLYSLNATVRSGEDWFEVETRIVDDEGEELQDIEPFIKLAKDNLRWVKLSDGTLVINDGINEKYREFVEVLRLRRGEKKRINRYEFLSLRDYDFLKLDKLSKRIISALKRPGTIKKVGLPELKFPLRNYQKEGFYWLNFLLENEFGGILADDMGLGKTVQVISLIAKDRGDRPYLIVAPTTVTNNWRLEFEKFTYDIRPHVLTSGKDVKNASYRGGEVFITSYNLVQMYVEDLRDVNFRFVILDEAQAIKNPLSKRARAVKELRADFKLAITGTPIENSLTELWSIFDFLMPGFLGDYRSFREKYIGNQKNLEILRKKVSPFILRRTKENVLKDLPPRIEQVVLLDMGKKQRTLYNRVLSLIKRDMQKDRERLTDDQFRFKVLTYLLRLRQICLYPPLIDEKFTKESVKLEKIREMVKEIVESGHRVLVFSQFVKMLRVLEDEFKKLSIPYLYMDGGTGNRQAIIERFQQGGRPVFLLSLKAGGLGINLTQADYVIIFDPWWNPAVEMQATDRAHRIGQKKTVFVYKLIVKGTVEEKILRLQERKRELARSVIPDDGSLLKKLTPDEIEEIFSP